MYFGYHIEETHYTKRICRNVKITKKIFAKLFSSNVKTQQKINIWSYIHIHTSYIIHTYIPTYEQTYTHSHTSNKQITHTYIHTHKHTHTVITFRRSSSTSYRSFSRLMSRKDNIRIRAKT